MIVLDYVIIHTWNDYYERSEYLKLEVTVTHFKTHLSELESELHTLAIL